MCPRQQSPWGQCIVVWQPGHLHSPHPCGGRATEVLVLLGQGQPLRLQPGVCPVALSAAYTRLASPDLKPPSRWRGCVQLQSHCSGVSASPVTSPG